MPAEQTALLEVARRLPKVDLHCHLIGTVGVDTVRALALREGVEWDADPGRVYETINSVPPAGVEFGGVRLPTSESGPMQTNGHSLLTVTEWVADLLTRQEDFIRVGYEAAVGAYGASNTRHLELHVEVGAFRRRGLEYVQVVDGLIEGLTAAQADSGVSSRLIAAIDRSRPAGEALEVVDDVAAHPRAQMVGIGLDNLETTGPPERFAAAYARAAEIGLRRTAHAGEHDPTARNVAACIEVLDCERVDHGYFALTDPDLISRCRDRQIPFTCIFTTSRRSWRAWRRTSIAALLAAGIAVVLASDDPAMFPTSLSAEYEIGVVDLGLGLEALLALSRRGVDAAWIAEEERRALHASFDDEITRLLQKFLPAPTNGQ